MCHSGCGTLVFLDGYHTCHQTRCFALLPNGSNTAGQSTTLQPNSGVSERSLRFRRGPFRRSHFHLSCGHVSQTHMLLRRARTSAFHPQTALFITANFNCNHHRVRRYSGSPSPVSKPFRELMISLRTVNKISPFLYTFKGSVTTRRCIPALSGSTRHCQEITYTHSAKAQSCINHRFSFPFS